MKPRNPARTAIALAVLGIVSTGVRQAAAEEGPARTSLKVFATVPNLAALADAVGGEAVNVTTMVLPREDPHFAEARPSFVKALHDADLLLAVGLGLEAGYLDTLVNNARNSAVLPGQPGYVLASTVILPMQQPAGIVSRAIGDVHPGGNPHFLLDPVSGLAVADLLRERMAALLPTRAAYFAERTEKLRHRIGSSLVGVPLDEKYDGTKLARLFSAGKLTAFLEKQGDADKLEGWLARMAPYHGTPAVDDHDMWPYFAERFGIRIVGHLEPLPGVQPTTHHLKEVIERMNAGNVKMLVASIYYDPRHARFVSERTGARIALLAHEVGAVDDARDYVDMVDYNVRTIADAIAATR
ncbi:MAG: zinc ABC transporter substrate-binding protein [Myxococcales bacterium]|nr:MAG: zinc ABC transporter substrate-binding protein [Myxococcales bacterium]